jgi:peptidoglycan endopeptidase LytE
MRIFSLPVVLLFCMFFLPSYTFAETTYKVKKGDSLYKISKKFKVSIDEIKIKNAISSSRIQPGTKLCMPTRDKKRDKEVVGQNGTPGPGEKALLTMSKDAGYYHIVEKGDSLLTISKRYAVSVRDLRELNNLRSTRIKPGQKILLCEIKSDEQPKKCAALISEKKTKKEKSKIETNYHIVKKGETLSSISKKYPISVSELKEINDLKSIRLKPGQQLLVKKIVPKTYTAKKGDTLSKIARKFAVDADELRDINGLETDRLRPGQNLFLKQETEPEEQTQYAAILSEEKIKDNVPDISIPEDLGLKDKLILFAKKFMNIPYRFGGTSIFGIDCSGYVQKVYSMIGVNLPRSAREQFHEGQPVDTGELSIGDLVFFRTYAPFPSHVGIYLGDNLFIHASSRGKKVTIDSLTEPFYIKRFIGAKRVLREDTLEGG